MLRDIFFGGRNERLKFLRRLEAQCRKATPQTALAIVHQLNRIIAFLS